MKNNKQNRKLCLEELAKQHPILTEEEMGEFMTYEEIISEAKRLFDEAIEKIQQEYDSHTS